MTYPYQDVKEGDLYPSHWCRFEKREIEDGSYQCSSCKRIMSASLLSTLISMGFLEFCPHCRAKVIDDV